MLKCLSYFTLDECKVWTAVKIVEMLLKPPNKKGGTSSKDTLFGVVSVSCIDFLVSKPINVLAT